MIEPLSYSEMHEILGALTYEGQTNFWRLNQVDMNVEGEGIETGFRVLACIRIIDREDGEETTLWRSTYISPEHHKKLTPSNLVKIVREMLIYLVLHEVDEQILYDGKRLFDPHTEII
jgi:hypothetical protein